MPRAIASAGFEPLLPPGKPGDKHGITTTYKARVASVKPLQGTTRNLSQCTVRVPPSKHHALLIPSRGTHARLPVVVSKDWWGRRRGILHLILPPPWRL